MSQINIENEIVMKKIEDIKPYSHNPRVHDKTVELLCKIIPKVGFNVPLVIDKDNVIVKGHARYEAGQKLGMAELPCIITHADPEAIRADRIADNRISEFSEWINEQLLHEVDMLDLNLDFAEFGLPKLSLDNLPSFDDFMSSLNDDSDNYDSTPKTDDDKKRAFLEFLEEQSKQKANNVSITTESAIRSAENRQTDIPKKREYMKCTCRECGHVMFVNKDIFK